MEIILSNGQVAYVDDQDADIVNGYTWSLSSQKYVRRGYRDKETGKYRSHVLHRLIVNAPKGFEVDHVDGDRLNNCRKNLRLCTRTYNNANRQMVRGNSKFKGVFWDASDSRWRAEVTLNQRTTCLGRFKSETEAALAYCIAAHELFGSFAQHATQKLLSTLIETDECAVSLQYAEVSNNAVRENLALAGQRVIGFDEYDALVRDRDRMDFIRKASRDATDGMYTPLPGAPVLGSIEKRLDAVIEKEEAARRGSA